MAMMTSMQPEYAPAAMPNLTAMSGLQQVPSVNISQCFLDGWHSTHEYRASQTINKFIEIMMTQTNIRVLS